MSLVAGAFLLLLLGTLHGRLHHTGHMWPQFIAPDAKIVFTALAVAAVLVIIFLSNQARFALSQQTDDVTEAGPLKVDSHMFTERVRVANRLVSWIAVGNVTLLIVGFACLVWQPIVQGFEVVATFGKIALSVIAIYLPLNYAARLQVESYLEKASAPARSYVWQRFTRMLFWVLIVYWAMLFAAYVTLLMNSKAYCHLLMC